MSSKMSFLGVAVAFSVATVLAGCGGSDGGVSSATAANAQPASNTPQQASGADAFISRVLAIIGNTSDTAEPIGIESITVTTPEDAQPVPVS